MEQQQQQPVSSPLPQQTESPNKDFTNNDSFTALLKQVTSDATTLESLRKKVAKRLEEEMKATNNSLFGTFVAFSAREASASAHNGIVLSCTHLGNGLSRDWGALKPQPYPVYFTVPLSYPANTPDIWFDESTPQANQGCFMGAREQFLEAIRGLPAPVSVSKIAAMWDRCARNALVEYARLHGGGDFFTAMGSWNT